MHRLTGSIGSKLTQLDEKKRGAEVEANPPLAAVDPTAKSSAMLEELSSVLDTLSSRRDLIGDRLSVPFYLPHLSFHTGYGTRKDVFYGRLAWEQNKLVLTVGHEGSADAFIRDGALDSPARTRALAEYNPADKVEDAVTRTLKHIDREMGRLLMGL